MRLGNGGKTIRLRDPPVLSVIVREIRVAVEEEEMRIQQLAVAAKRPHEYLHGDDVEEQTNVREHGLHVSVQYRTPATRGDRDRRRLFQSVNISTRPSLNAIRMFLKPVAMRSCE